MSNVETKPSLKFFHFSLLPHSCNFQALLCLIRSIIGQKVCVINNSKLKEGNLYQTKPINSAFLNKSLLRDQHVEKLINILLALKKHYSYYPIVVIATVFSTAYVIQNLELLSDGS